VLLEGCCPRTGAADQPAGHAGCTEMRVLKGALELDTQIPVKILFGACIRVFFSPSKLQTK